MIESLVLIEGQEVSEEALRSASLANALQLVVGTVNGFGTVLHINAESSAYLSDALRKFATIPGVTGVTTLAIRL
jgi:hypothetical protein